MKSALIEPVILASRSPRRRDLLNQLGISFELLDVEIDEAVKAGEKPLVYVERMAQSKADAGWQSLAISNAGNSKATESGDIREIDNHTALIAADTSVVFNDLILGKPESIDDAVSTLLMLSDNTHQVLTSIALKNRIGINLMTSITDVTFAKLSQKEIDDYCDSAEGMDKAGGYAIQGKAARFVKHINGSYSGVVGLCVYLTSCLLDKHSQQMNVG